MGNLREEDGGVVSLAHVNGKPVPRANEQGIMAKVRLQTWRGKLVSHQEEVHQLDVFEFPLAFEQSTQEEPWSRDVAAGEHAVATLNEAHGLLRAQAFAAIVLKPVHRQFRAMSAEY